MQSEAQYIVDDGHTWHLVLMPEQCQMARAHLGITQAGLGEISGLGTNTVQRFEAGEDVMLSTMEKLRYTLERIGIRITYDDDGQPGVQVDERLKAKMLGLN